jgi:hypothetical protein
LALLRGYSMLRCINCSGCQGLSHACVSAMQQPCF